MRSFLAAVSLILAAGPAAAAVARVSDFERFSVLTQAGSEEPRPALFAKSRRLLYAERRVQKGEYWAGATAKAYGTTLNALQATNDNEFAFMYPGLRMTVLNRDGKLYVVKKTTETLDQVVARFQKDKEGARKLKEIVVRVNNLPGVALLAPYEMEKGTRLAIPGVRVNFDTYRIPFETASWGRISSRFGYRFHPLLKRRRMHEGVDIAKPYGTPVYASRSGRVTQAGWHEGYGQLIEVRHPSGEVTRYGHLSKINVKVGDVAVRGKTLLGRVGSTGISTGPHLHFEVRDKYGKPKNPQTSIGRR
jgi:murein DD-endopeptidase MepM/ murein hydrolase activator NlpD